MQHMDFGATFDIRMDVVMMSCIEARSEKVMEQVRASHGTHDIPELDRLRGRVVEHCVGAASRGTDLAVKITLHDQRAAVG